MAWATHDYDGLRHWAYELTPLSQPLPFFAYPFFAATLVGWAWVQYRDTA